MPDLSRARENLRVFAELVGRPLESWQAEALRLVARVTAIVAPRQSGKSRSLGVLATWWAFRQPGQRVLIVSAGDEAAKRLLAEVRSLVAGSPLLRASIFDEQAGLVTLSTGSEIRSVPASEKQIRGWAADLLLVDEAALVSDDLLLGAAFPTTAARPEARIVMASSATTATGGFYDHVQLGRQGAEHVAAFAWRLADARWIAPSVIAAARESMSPARFAAEYEGEFASAADALFPRALVDRATAEFVMPGLHALGAHAGLAGVDWGATTDRCALVAVSRLEAPRGLFAVTCAHAWPSGHPLDGPGGVVGEIAALPAQFEQVAMEVNGLGYPLAQALARRLRERHREARPRLEFVNTTAALKSATYSALRMLLEQGRLVLPAGAEALRRELLLLRVALTQGGGERIEAGFGHDDLADALMLAAGPYQDSRGEWRTRLADAAEREKLRSADATVPRAPVLARVGVPRNTVERVSYMQGGAPPVVTSGDLTFAGERYLDRQADGSLAPPSGWQPLDPDDPRARRAAEREREERDRKRRERGEQLRNGPGGPPPLPSGWWTTTTERTDE